MTLVTALYDIGRSDWLQWSRTFHEYLQYFESVLQLDVPMIIFVDKSLKQFVKQRRKGNENKTKVYIRNFTELGCYKHKRRIQDILASDGFKDNNEMLTSPEGNSTEYIILVNSKPSSVKYISDKNPFHTSHFFWIDAGYGHVINGSGEGEFPKKKTWTPCRLLEVTDKITMIKLTNLETLQYSHPLEIHKLNLYPPFAGGFFGGDAKAVSEYHEIYDKSFRMLLAENIVDDDQNVAYHSYRELPRLFNLVNGSWFDIFKIFPDNY